MISTFYCSACSTELISTGCEPYSEAYYICPTCLAEYTVTETGEHTVVIQAELNQENI